jgi:thioredoxin 1
MPTQVFFDAQGREIGRNMGKVSAGEILARLGVSSPERMP